VSVGNLIVGGSGKSPMVLELASRVENSAIILRGYKRKSKGVQVVSKDGGLLISLKEAGDEAFMLGGLHKSGFVIVAEDRFEGVKKAHELGCALAFLDDGFRHKIEKFDVILEPFLKPYFNFTLPSGAYRLPPSLKKHASFVLKEGVDFKRVVTLHNETPRMLLLSAIANPSRLEAYLPKEGVVDRIFLSDHSEFDFDKIREYFKKIEATSLLVTRKDAVKLEGIGLPLSFLELEIEIVNEEFETSLKSFLHQLD
jgi:tetraacyldisaccharide 4'-kinase